MQGNTKRMTALIIMKNKKKAFVQNSDGINVVSILESSGINKNNTNATYKTFSDITRNSISKYLLENIRLLKTNALE